jgi:hypothetical protein
MEAGSLATNCSNTVTHARVTNTYKEATIQGRSYYESQELETQKECAGH